MYELEKLLPNFPQGPLDVYRNQASFAWKDLAALIDGIDGLKIRVCI